MTNEIKMNQPVYLFLGFRLIEAVYKRLSDSPLDTFGVKIIESKLNSDKVHILTIQFSMTFSESEESKFIFNAGYQINDFKWYKEMGKEQIDSLFFSVVFPYVREKIYSLSNDYRGCVDIPILDLRHVNLTNGITFNREIKE